MRLCEIASPSTHPHIAEIVIDPVDLHRLVRMIDDARELRLLDVEDREPEIWIVRVGCASDRVRERLEDAWD